MKKPARPVFPSLPGRLLPLAFLALSVAGCGQQEGKGMEAATALPAPVDACSLLSGKTLEELFGNPFPDSPRAARYGDDAFWTSTCNWFSDAANNSVTLLVRPNDLDPDPARAYALYVENLKEGQFAAGSLAPVEGLGAPAGWDADARQLTFFKGGYLYVLGVGLPGADEDSLLETLKSLAVRLPPVP